MHSLTHNLPWTPIVDSNARYLLCTLPMRLRRAGDALEALAVPCFIGSRLRVSLLSTVTYQDYWGRNPVSGHTILQSHGKNDVPVLMAMAIPFQFGLGQPQSSASACRKLSSK